jgi:hypothetical protein
VRAPKCLLLTGLLLGWGAPIFGQNSPLGFEGLADNTVLTTQIPGATFTNAIVVSSGITLNEFESPPHSGSNTASDSGGPIAIAFTSPLSSFSAYFTYATGLTVQAFGATNNLLGTASSHYSDNEAMSGAPANHANELIQVQANGIYKVVITGSAQGASFDMDDATLITLCDVTKDGYTNVADTQAMINEALGGSQPNNDLNNDGVVDVVDIQIVINAAMGGACSAT